MVRNIKVRACASTGIAAMLLIKGTTIHSIFFVPNEIESNTLSKLGCDSLKAQELRETKVFIMDEISMLHRYVLEYIDKLLRDIVEREYRHLPFGGKIILIGGDWKQLTPVVIRGDKNEHIDASIKEFLS